MKNLNEQIESFFGETWKQSTYSNKVHFIDCISTIWNNKNITVLKISYISGIMNYKERIIFAMYEAIDMEESIVKNILAKGIRSMTDNKSEYYTLRVDSRNVEIYDFLTTESLSSLIFKRDKIEFNISEILNKLENKYTTHYAS